MQDFRTMAAMGGCGGVGIFSGDRRMRPHPGQAIKCPRCESLNTKFCYYNNYNLSQPRHFCKSCRRYWTKGGVLRNVPVGGGCRKAKRPKSKSSPDRPSRHDDRNGDQLTGSSSSSNPGPTAYAAEASASLASGVAPFGDIDPNSLPATGMAECLDFPLANSFTSLTTAAMNSTGIGFSGAADPICAQRQKQNGGDDGKNDINVNSGQNEKYAGETETVGLQAWQLQGQLGKEGELAGLEWPANCGGDPGLFELAATLEQGYHSWGNQAQTHWSEMDQSLYLP